MLFNKNIPVLIAMLLMITAFITMGYCIERTQFSIFIISAGTCFAGFLFLLKSERISSKNLLYFSILCRAIFIFSLPVLSDDYFRFLWDGHLMNMGINPFLALPSALIEQAVYGEKNASLIQATGKRTRLLKTLILVTGRS